MQQSQAVKYGMKAAELRAIADDDDFAETKADLYRIAESYDKLALSFEKLENRDSRNYS